MVSLGFRWVIPEIGPLFSTTFGLSREFGGARGGPEDVKRNAEFYTDITTGGPKKIATNPRKTLIYNHIHSQQGV